MSRWLFLVLLLVFAGFTIFTETACQTVDPCPVNSAQWVEFDMVPDSLKVVPDFFFEQPTVVVHHVIICEHGIFFNFHAFNKGADTEYYLSFPLPTYNEYYRHVPLDTLMSFRAINDSNYVRNKVKAEVAKAMVRYQELKKALRCMLDSIYDERRIIDFSSSSSAAFIRLEFELAFIYNNEEVRFHTYPGIYWRK